MKCIAYLTVAALLISAAATSTEAGDGNSRSLRGYKNGRGGSRRQRRNNYPWYSGKYYSTKKNKNKGSGGSLPPMSGGKVPAWPQAPIAPQAPVPVAPAPVAPVPVAPTTPVVPVAPVAPAPLKPAPVAPLPVAPVAPIAPAPIAPVAPIAPIAPKPVAPLPVAPVPVAPKPVAPVPVAPVAPVAPPAQGPISAAEQAAILAVHREVRAAVNPPASNMGTIVWDNTVAASAQAFANTCPDNHAKNNPYGENLSWGSPSQSGVAASKNWASEGKGRDCTNCGHYTAMIWATTTKIGCGTAICPSIGVLGGRPGQVWVCRYDPPGNWMGQKPYVAARRSLRGAMSEATSYTN